MNKRTVQFCLVAVMLLWALPAFASGTTGTVSDSHKFAWGENIGWINFAPTDGTNYVGLNINNGVVSGFGWSNNFGWINFNPTNSGQGVTVDTTTGHFAGYVWVSGFGGWLNMSGVAVNSVGKFVGTAGTVDKVGRVVFDCTYCDVQTDWIPSAPDNQGGGGGSGGNGGSGGSGDVVLPSYLGGGSGGGTGVAPTQQTVSTLPAISPIVTHESAGTQQLEPNNPATSVDIKLPPNKNLPPFSVQVTVPTPTVDNPAKLVNQVDLTNFGKEQTPVDITYAIYDDKGVEVYSSRSGLIVEGGRSHQQSFDNLRLDPGNYVVVTTVSFGNVAKKEFRQNITVKRPLAYYIIVGGEVIFALLVGFVVIRYRLLLLLFRWLVKILK